MRLFYIFNIKKEFYNLTKEDAYNLYQALEHVYYLNRNDIDLAMNILESICNIFDKDKLNKLIYKNNADKDIYIKFNNIHTINNFYNDEQTKLIVNNIYLEMKSSKEYPIFFNDLKSMPYIFIADFENKDYFWLSALNVKTIS